MRLSTYLTISVITFALLTACSTGLPAGYQAQAQAVDGVTVTFEHPQNAKLLQEQALFVRLADGAGKPIDGASVYFELTMPAMQMGSNQPVAEALGGGRYQVRSAFTMEGDWKIRVVAMIAGKEYAAMFDQVVVLP